MFRSRSSLAAVALCCAAGVLPPAGAAAGVPTAAGAPTAPTTATMAGAPTAADHAPEASKPAPARPRALIGPVTREQVEAAAPAWVQAGVEAKPDLAAAHALAAVEPGAEVTVLLGTWCGDSRREVSRLWRALDEIGATAEGGARGGLPFTLTYIGIDEAKQQPAAAVTAAGLQFVPTLIVRRNGREVGRIVETSPHGVEIDLLALLDGKASGLVTASPDARAAAGSPQGAPPHRR